jgi:hypothetical protein
VTGVPNASVVVGADAEVLVVVGITISVTVRPRVLAKYWQLSPL